VYLLSCSKEVGHASIAYLIPSLQVVGRDIEYVDSWTHLGHILSSDCRDNKVFEHRRVQTVKQINDLLSYFGKLDAMLNCNYSIRIVVVCMALSYGTCLVVLLMSCVSLGDVP